MKFTELSLPGVYLIELDLIKDERGFFARSFCSKEFSQYGLCSRFEQCNISFNIQKGTLRGMHYQTGEQSEAKLIRCSMGTIYDVLLDLRPESPTYKKWIAVKLSATNRKMIYVPEGFAHGFQTLEDQSEIFYQMSVSFAPNSTGGVRWNDPAFNIQWPLPPSIISQKDQSYSDFDMQQILIIK